jgi:hypothetical protein
MVTDRSITKTIKPPQFCQGKKGKESKPACDSQIRYKLGKHEAKVQCRVALRSRATPNDLCKLEKNNSIGTTGDRKKEESFEKVDLGEKV